MLDNSVYDLFGLDAEQTKILFSLLNILVENDIEETKNEKVSSLKKEWLDDWIQEIQSTLLKGEQIYHKSVLNNKIIEVDKTSENTIWYKLIILEMVSFDAYFPIHENKNPKRLKNLKYKEQNDYMVNVLSKYYPLLAEDLFIRYKKVYSKSLNTGFDKNRKFLIRGLTVVAFAALTAAAAGAAAPVIAVALKGGAFVGLNGAALVSASLAALGGGAVAIGGAGMAGGTLVIVGGGGLLGGAIGGAFVAGTGLLAKNSPDLVISQGAKLSVVLREIILNSQKDTLYAQNILLELKKQILNLNEEVATLRLDQSKQKTQIKNLEKAIKGLERIYKETNVFKSSFEIGLEAIETELNDRNDKDE